MFLKFQVSYTFGKGAPCQIPWLKISFFLGVQNFIGDSKEEKRLWNIGQIFFDAGFSGTETDDKGHALGPRRAE